MRGARCRTTQKTGRAQLRKQLAEIRNQRCELAHRQIMLCNEPRMFAAQFWRDFSRAMLAKSRRNTKNRLPLLVLASAGLGTTLAHAQVVVHADPNTVIAIDLSTSVGTPGPDGKTDFQKNVNGVTHVLSYLTSGSSVTVIGITDHSYAQPYVLLSAHISDDPGYFGERLTRARAQLIRELRRLSRTALCTNLKSSCSTDAHMDDRDLGYLLDHHFEVLQCDQCREYSSESFFNLLQQVSCSTPRKSTLRCCASRSTFSITGGTTR
jgi:hypothetical protein